MNIKQLKYFLEVYRLSSISLAAQNLSVTQPALSQQIAYLERDLKIQLFERSKRGMKPTAAARRLAGRAQGILAQLAELALVVKGEEPPNEIAFAVGETLASVFVPIIVSDLRRRFKVGRFRVIESTLTEIKTALKDDTVDFALSPEPIADKSYFNRFLTEDEIVPAVAATNSLANGTATHTELVERDWILFHPGSAIRKISDTLFGRSKPRIAMELRSVAGVVRCLEEDLGIGFISNLSLTPKLRALPVPEFRYRRKFYLVYKKNNRNITAIAEAIATAHGSKAPAYD